MQVRKIYDRLQRNEQNRVAAAAAAVANATPGVAPPPAGTRAPPPSFLPPPRSVSAAAAGTTDVVAENTTAVVVENRWVGKVARAEGCCGGDGVQQSALQVGERINDAVRVLSVSDGSEGGESRVGCGWLAALTLSEAELSRPKRLLDDLRLITCRPVDGAEEAAATATTTVPPQPESGEGGDVGGAQTEQGVSAAAAAAPTAVIAEAPAVSGAKVGFLTPALAEEEARRAGASPPGSEKHLVETAWLAERFPKATLGDLLVNQLELSLWASYWNRRRPRASSR